MNVLRSTRLYQGGGESLAARGVEMPLYQQRERLHDPQHYLADENLLDAVNVALSLDMPLLITGEPGTGKTELAYSVAWELGLGEPEVFHTKSTSMYTDLFYQYDALRHFRDVQIESAAWDGRDPADSTSTENYVTLGPLGRAILFGMNRSASNLPSEFRNQPLRRTVVLIDELDKAPRDLPNDILNEIDRMTFQIKELPPDRNTFSADAAYRPILILTSNLEKDLPDAFRRRCVFYHIEFDDLDIREIIRRRLPDVPEFTKEILDNALTHFRHLRATIDLDKKPATAELLAWMALLQRLRLDLTDVKNLNDEDRVALSASYCLLAKSDDDLTKLREGTADVK